MSKVENNIELLHEQLIKEMQLTPEEIEIYKKNNNLNKQDMVAQEAKFELVKYSLQGRITEYLVKLYDADGHVELYHITDYYNKDISEITGTKIWRLQAQVNIVNENLIENDSRLGKKILTFISNEHFYRNDVLESMYVKEMEDKIDDYCNREY